MPKAHRGGSTGLLRSHSRTSSSTKIGANLQFTQKEQLPSKVIDKPKKNGYNHDVNQAQGKGTVRVASAQRVHSRDQIQPFASKRPPAPQNQKNNGSKSKSGFTIASPGNEDEDEWVSSESGAATPNNENSDSETESDDNTPDEELIRRLAGEYSPHTARPTNGARSDVRSETPVLPRVETARPSDFTAAVMKLGPPPALERPETRTPALPPINTEAPSRLQHTQPLRSETVEERPIPEMPSPSQPSPRVTSKRQSTTRPPSTHSTRGEHPLRPHPLIRGHSYGQVYPAKPSPLEPLTVIQDAATSVSPPGSMLDNNHLSTSPSSSIKTTFPSPASPELASSSQQRRTSVSSARSVATLPIHSNLRDSVNWSLSDRKRTQSSVSHSSSSAALSSLVHLPTVTRPPSPQAISFFPPVNPHANIEGIHPLLPGPYLHNHLTVLARRTPIKEAFDRVIRAKQVRP